jgi:3-oxoacyl-[acyl-carrier protein] reductase
VVGDIEPTDGAVELDVRNAASWEAALAETVREHGTVDILVNNAAVTVRRPFFEIDEAEWDDVLAVNLRGVFFGCQLAGRLMRERRSGRIVNLSSLAGQIGGTVNGAHYAASKAGILALTKVVARELAGYGVTVNAVAPAAIDGPVMAALPPDQVDALAASIPLGRLGTPEEVAALVAFLVSEEAGFVTGATFDVNGGLSMR